MKIERFEDIQAWQEAREPVAEVQSHLYITRDLGYLSDEDFDRIYEMAGETAKLITGFIKYLKGLKQ